MIDVYAQLSTNKTVQRRHTCFEWLPGVSYEIFRLYEPRLSQRSCMINPKQRKAKAGLQKCSNCYRCLFATQPETICISKNLTSKTGHF